MHSIEIELPPHEGCEGACVALEIIWDERGWVVWDPIPTKCPECNWEFNLEEIAEAQELARNTARTYDPEPEPYEPDPDPDYGGDGQFPY